MTGKFRRRNGWGIHLADFYSGTHSTLTTFPWTGAIIARTKLTFNKWAWSGTLKKKCKKSA
jgi:hypothetical protein